MNLLLWWLVFACLGWSVQYLLTLSALVRVRFGYPSGSLVAEADVPEYIQDLLARPIDRLQALGFRDYGYLQIKPSILNHPVVRWGRLLVDSSGCHFAIIGLRYPVNPRDPLAIDFYTWFTDHHLLLTVDRQAHGIIDCFPNTTLRDNRIHNLSGQWLYHQQEFEILAQNRTPINHLSQVGFADFYCAHVCGYFDHGIAEKIFLPEPNLPTYRLGFIAALRYTDRFIRRKPKPQLLKESISLSPQILNDNAQMLSGSHLRPFDRRTKIWLFILSLVLFYLIAIPTMGWEFGLQLLIVIFIHELGHLLAMQIFGYRNTSMLMIPLLGGVAVGKKDDATLSQKFWVSILGPLPGIILGISLAIYTHQHTSVHWLHSFAMVSITINLLNLLPIYPLDGGRIVNLLLQPYPYIGFIFKLICAIFLIGFGCFGEWIFAVIGMIIIISLPTDLRTAQAISHLKKQQAPANLDRESWFEWASTHLASDRGAIVKPAQQKIFIDNLWAWKSDRHAAAGLRWGLSGIYAISLFGGIIGGLYGAFGNHLMGISNAFVNNFQTKDMNPSQRQQYYQAKQRRDLIDLSATIAKNPDDIQAYKRRLRIRRYLGDRPGMLADLNRLITLEPDKVTHYQERMFLYIELKEDLAALKDSDLLLQLKGENRDLTFVYFQRADLYIRLKDPAKAIGEYDRSIQLAPNNLSTYLKRANLYLQVNKKDLATRDLAAATALDSDYYHDYEDRAKLRDKLGDKQGAIVDRQKAKAIESKTDEL
jgi:Zn-dependent protease/tetratricopeptide (TPR) repeat protein